MDPSGSPSNPKNQDGPYHDPASDDYDGYTSSEYNSTEGEASSPEQSTYNEYYTTAATTQTTVSTPTTSVDLEDATDNDTSSSSSGGGLSTNTKVAIAVPVAVVGAAIIAAIIFFLIRRRRRQRQRISQPPVISPPRMETTSSLFIPAHIEPVPLPPPAPGNQRSMPDEHEPFSLPPHPSEVGVAQTTPPVPAVVAVPPPDLEWRTSEERRAIERPQSPFSHPHDPEDSMSVVSDINDREGAMRTRAVRDDDMSSVSSFEDDEPRPSMNRPR